MRDVEEKKAKKKIMFLLCFGMMGAREGRIG